MPQTFLIHNNIIIQRNIYILSHQVINFAEKQWNFNLRKFYNKLEPFKTPGALKKEMDFYEPEEFFKFLNVMWGLTSTSLYLFI